MNQLPAHLQARRPNALTQAVSQGLSSGAPPYLSIRANRFTLVDAAGNERMITTTLTEETRNENQRVGEPYIDIIVVHANRAVSRVYYDKPFNPNAKEYSPPTCFSDNGIGASRAAQIPQSLSCSTCPKAVWGSSISNVSGKGIPACSQGKKLAFILASDPGMPFLLKVPPNSLKYLEAYTKILAAQQMGNQQVQISDVVTRLTFDPEVQGTLNFSAVAIVDERCATAMYKIWDTNSADDLVGLNDTPYQGPINLLGAPVAQAHPQGQLAPPPMPAQQQFPPPQLAQPAAAPSAQQAPSAPPAATSSPPNRGRGRPKKDAAAPQVPAFMQGGLQAGAPAPVISQTAFVTRPQMVPEAQGLELPTFLRRDQPVTAPAQPAERFGMVNQAPQPSADLSAAIDRALNLPLPKG